MPDNTTVEEQIQDILHDLLVSFNYIGHDVDNSNAICTTDVQTGCNESSAKRVEDENAHNLKSNYFKNQLRQLAAKSSHPDVPSEDEMSHMSVIVRKHPFYKSIENSVDDGRICPKRDAMEKIAAEFQRKQGESVNSRRAKLEKEILDVGDIGTIKVEGNTRAATDDPWLPVMVTFSRIISPGNVVYKLCSQNGHLRGEFVRSSIYYHKYMTAKILKINPLAPNFEQNLTVATASAKYNKLGGATFCKCKRNCLGSKRCSCIALGKLCGAKCHKPRKDGKPIHCLNCTIEL